MATEADVIELLADFQAAYNHEPKDAEGLIRAWTRALAHQDAGLFSAAYEQVIATSKWFPKVSEFMDALRFVADNGGRSVLARDLTEVEVYWNGMSYLSHALRTPGAALSDRRLAGFLHGAQPCGEECCREEV